MKLVDNWKSVARRAWSFHLMVLATLLGCVEALLPYFADSMPRGVFAAATVAVSLLALLARLIAQPTLHGAPNAQ